MNSDYNFDELIDQVAIWANERDLLHDDYANRQMLKVVEEIGELASALAKDDMRNIIDSIGDSFVTLIILSYQLGISPNEALYQAYNEIKDRKGKTQGGVFIKS